MNANKILKYENLEFRKQNQLFKGKFIRLEGEIIEIQGKIEETEEILLKNMNDEITARIINLTGDIEKEISKISSMNENLMDKIRKVENNFNEKVKKCIANKSVHKIGYENLEKSDKDMNPGESNIDKFIT